MTDYKNSKEKFIVEYVIKHTGLPKEKAINIYRLAMRDVKNFMINNNTKLMLYLGGHLKLQLSRTKISKMIRISKGKTKYLYLNLLNILNKINKEKWSQK